MNQSLIQLKLQNLLMRIRQNPQKYMRVGVIILLLAVALCLRMNQSAKDELIVEESNDEVSEEVVSDYIYVDISGEVKSPGIYKLEGETRLYQLIDKAGGLTDKADINLINQAESITDGQKIIIPTVSEEGEASAAGSISSDGRVNINTASASELSTLPGIGDAIAQRIIEYRTNNRFKNKEDLMNVSGIGEKTYAKLETMIVI